MRSVRLLTSGFALANPGISPADSVEGDLTVFSGRGKFSLSVVECSMKISGTNRLLKRNTAQDRTCASHTARCNRDNLSKYGRGRSVPDSAGVVPDYIKSHFSAAFCAAFSWLGNRILLQHWLRISPLQMHVPIHCLYNLSRPEQEQAENETRTILLFMWSCSWNAIHILCVRENIDSEET